MKAIFDKDCNCVGWYDEQNRMLYDIEIRWIGFVEQNSLFSNSTKWVGGMMRGTIVDKAGKPVAWIDGYKPQSTGALLQPLTPLHPLTPLRPLKPLSPLRPLRPLTPIGGWSNYSWIQFINQR